MSDYAADIQEYRRRKDAHFASGRGPIARQQLAGFQGLAYYPPDERYALTVPVERLEMPEAVTIGTTSGEDRDMLRYGTARLSLPDGEATLTLYAQPGDEHPERLFVPFRDATSGPESYGAGRYIDAPLIGDHVQLDFNLAYHPYCAYGDGWTCPVPPRENWLSLPVRAGERNPEVQD